MTEVPSHISKGAWVWDIRNQCYGEVEDWRWNNNEWIVNHTGLGPGAPLLTPVGMLMPAYVLVVWEEELTSMTPHASS